MRQRHERMIDPAIGRRVREDRLGGVPAAALVRQDERQDRYDRVPPFVLAATLGPWFREDVAASATSAMRLLALGTSSTNPAVAALIYNGTAGGGSAVTMANPVRVVAGMLHTPQTITAGSITLGVRIAGVTTAISDARLDAANTIGAMAWLDWEHGVIAPAGADVVPVLIGSGSLAPAGAVDVSAWLVVAHEQPGR